LSFVTPLELSGRHARLVPRTLAHHDQLVEAVMDGELWQLWYTFIPAPEKMRAEIERRLDLQARGTMLPFAVLDAASGRAVGMSAYMNIDAQHRRLEIGSTWYRKSVQRTALNTECKLMLLRHAFETLHCIAVEFRTHFFNQQSRRGIERLGARLDGVLRAHQIAPNGTLRDTCVYSITASEWPTVQAHLSHRLERPC
jgi:RimJ/RimL family protein N-acetyltransferase